jgi:steroid delta-isomerase-like uncharacterized protein
MSAEANKALAREFIDQVWNELRPDLVEKYMSEDFLVHDAPGITDRESLKNYVAAIKKAFPDYKISIEQEIAEGDLVVHRSISSGTQTGGFEALGLPATGKPVSVVGVFVFRIANGKIAELWGTSDGLGMMQQLGVIPVPGAS